MLVNRLHDLTRLATTDLGGPGPIIDVGRSAEQQRAG